MSEIAWGPSGKDIYDRTYSRTKANGEKETWPETVHRVVRGNIALVYGDDVDAWSDAVVDEYALLYDYMLDFRILPAGRHLWASGTKSPFLFNCHTSGWDTKLSDHFRFSFMRLMEGGGVGANYSEHYLAPYGMPRRGLKVHVVADVDHPDYQEMLDAGLLSAEYNSDWDGAFEVEDSREGWAAALVDLIDTYMTDDDVKHSNRVYDVSRVRGKGARLKTFGGTASGPGPFAQMMGEVSRVLNLAELDVANGAADDYDSYRAWDGRMSVGIAGSGRSQLTSIEAMEMDHAIAECVVSGGNRRSARMSMVHWTDPKIDEFIRCKADTGKHWTTNISIEIDDEFLEQLNDGCSWASSIHEAAVQSMLANGEPGYFNSSLANEGEVNPIYTTNPCLSGDTVISTLDGPRTFKELAEVGEDVRVHAWHPETKRPVVRWMRRPHMTKRQARVLEVEFDSGLKVKATPDHNFFSFRGEKVEAQNLRVGQSVRAWSMSRAGSIESGQGHLRVHAWDSARNTAIHQWVHRMSWECEYGKVADGLIVNHLNEDVNDNGVDNLSLMTMKGHNRFHYEGRKLNGFDGTCRNHKVVAVREAGVEDVYNGCVDDAHSYIVLDPEPVSGIASGIVSANCGEIPLEPWEACNLGHVNMDAFAPKVKGASYDYDGLMEAHHLMTRFLLRATFADINDPVQKKVQDRNRRIGVGHFGVQGFLVKCGLPMSEVAHGSDESIWFSFLLESLSDKVSCAAREYAFELRIPEPVKTRTVAPTGTIAKLAGATEGIHPVYGRFFKRRIRYSKTDSDQHERLLRYVEDGFHVEDDVYDQSRKTAVVTIPTKNILVEQVEALGYDPSIVEAADELSLVTQLEFQALYQEHWADNAVSFTVNVPEGQYSVEYVSAELRNMLPRLKGTTIMPDGTRAQAPYERISEGEYLTSTVRSVEDSVDEDCASGACPVR